MAAWDEFIELLNAQHDASALTESLHIFLTPAERDALAMRYKILSALLLDKGTQRDLAQKLGVSIAKITRGANLLKNISLEERARLLSACKQLKGQENEY